MDSFQWTKDYETGLREVDDQHRRLVDIVNQYSGYLTEGRLTPDTTGRIFDELGDYALHHFDDEEKLMRNVGIDERHVDAHRIEHRDFLRKVKALRSGPTVDDEEGLRNLLDYLIHWLAFHILGADQNMARQIRMVEKGTGAAEAFRTQELVSGNAAEPLIRALGLLFDQVTARNKELSRLNATLEEKVRERTRDLTDANRRLEEMALTDALTGLFNRRYALRFIRTLWDESRLAGAPLGCLMIDADSFKEVNDTWGHDAGDDVLKELARALGHSLRTDDVLCRLGGDEFFVICPETDAPGLRRVAEQVLSSVNDLKVVTGDGHWRGSVSIGVASMRPDMAGHEDLVKEADMAVYAAKRDGRNCIRAAKD